MLSFDNLFKHKKNPEPRPTAHADYFDAQNKSGRTALHKAIIHENLPGTKDLLTANINVNVADDLGETPLHYAATKETSAYTSALLAKSAEVALENKRGEFPLHKAVLAGRYENVALLLNQNKQLLNKKTNASSPLHYAFLNNIDKDIVEALVKAGADTRSKDSTGCTPLHLGLANQTAKNLSSTSWLALLNGFDLTSKDNLGQTILHIAAANPHLPLEIFKSIALKVSKADAGNTVDKSLFNILDNDGHTPLLNAVIVNDEDKINLLLECDVSTNIAKKTTPLIEAIKNNNEEVALSLIKKCADVDATDSYKRTPTFYAAERGNFKILEHLKDYGAKFSATENDAAVQQSLLNNKIDVMTKLIEYGCNPNVHVYPNPAKKKLLGITTSSCSDIEDAGTGIDKTGRLRNGDTPLHFAVVTENADLVIQILKKKPWMVNVANDNADTPPNIAIKRLSHEMAHLLWLHGALINVSQKYINHSTGREKTLFMTAMSHGIESGIQLDQFLHRPKYELTKSQAASREKMLAQENQSLKAGKNQLMFKSSEKTVSKSEIVDLKQMDKPPTLSPQGMRK